MAATVFKHFATLRARAVLLGVTLIASRTDAEQHSFIVTKDAVTHEMPSLDAVEMMLDELAQVAHAGGQSA
jgi:hypothetical protein